MAADDPSYNQFKKIIFAKLSLHQIRNLGHKDLLQDLDFMISDFD
jgi:hypothetical protein